MRGVFMIIAGLASAQTSPDAQSDSQSQMQCALLLATFKKMGGNDQSAPSEIDCCSQLNITCEDDTITAIDWSNSKLSGQMPEFDMFTSLKSLKLENNEITTISSSLFHLSSLSHLSLASNMIAGTIDKNLAQATNLRVVDLSKNRITGSLPDVFDKLPNLIRLSINNNAFFGKFPGSLTMCSSLQVLEFHQNSMTGAVPGLIFNLPNMNIINLSDNNFDGLVDIIALPEFLNTLDLSGNKLLGGSIPFPNAYIQRMLLNETLIGGEFPKGFENIAADCDVTGSKICANAAYSPDYCGVLPSCTAISGKGDESQKILDTHIAPVIFIAPRKPLNTTITESHNTSQSLRKPKLDIKEPRESALDLIEREILKKKAESFKKEELAMEELQNKINRKEKAALENLESTIERKKLEANEIINQKKKDADSLDEKDSARRLLEKQSAEIESKKIKESLEEFKKESLRLQGQIASENLDIETRAKAAKVAAENKSRQDRIEQEKVRVATISRLDSERAEAKNSADRRLAVKAKEEFEIRAEDARVAAYKLQEENEIMVFEAEKRAKKEKAQMDAIKLTEYESLVAAAEKKVKDGQMELDSGKVFEQETSDASNLDKSLEHSENEIIRLSESHVVYDVVRLILSKKNQTYQNVERTWKSKIGNLHNVSMKLKLSKPRKAEDQDKYSVKIKDKLKKPIRFIAKNKLDLKGDHLLKGGKKLARTNEKAISLGISNSKQNKNDNEETNDPSVDIKVARKQEKRVKNPQLMNNTHEVNDKDIKSKSTKKNKSSAVENDDNISSGKKKQQDSEEVNDIYLDIAKGRKQLKMAKTEDSELKTKKIQPTNQDDDDIYFDIAKGREQVIMKIKNEESELKTEKKQGSNQEDNDIYLDIAKARKKAKMAKLRRKISDVEKTEDDNSPTIVTKHDNANLDASDETAEDESEEDEGQVDEPVLKQMVRKSQHDSKNSNPVIVQQASGTNYDLPHLKAPQSSFSAYAPGPQTSTNLLFPHDDTNRAAPFQGNSNTMNRYQYQGQQYQNQNTQVPQQAQYQSLTQKFNGPNQFGGQAPLTQWPNYQNQAAPIQTTYNYMNRNQGQQSEQYQQNLPGTTAAQKLNLPQYLNQNFNTAQYQSNSQYNAPPQPIIQNINPPLHQNYGASPSGFVSSNPQQQNQLQGFANTQPTNFFRPARNFVAYQPQTVFNQQPMNQKMPQAYSPGPAFQGNRPGQ